MRFMHSGQRLPLLVILCSILFTAATQLAWADNTLRVNLESLKCHHVTSGIGADQIYVFTLAVNLRTSSVQVEKFCFPHVCSGDIMWPNRQIADWSSVRSPDDVVLMALIMEQDCHSFPEHVIMEVVLKTTVTDFIRKFTPLYDRGQVTHQQMADLVGNQLEYVMRMGHDAGDDLIGMGETRLRQFLVDNNSGSPLQLAEWYRGDGASYTVTFSIESYAERQRQSTSFVSDLLLVSLDAEMQSSSMLELQPVGGDQFWMINEQTAEQSASFVDRFTAVHLVNEEHPVLDLSGTWTSSSGITHLIGQSEDWLLMWSAEPMGEMAIGHLATSRHLLAYWWDPTEEGTVEGLIATDYDGNPGAIFWSNGTVFWK